MRKGEAVGEVEGESSGEEIKQGNGTTAWAGGNLGTN